MKVIQFVFSQALILGFLVPTCFAQSAAVQNFSFARECSYSFTADSPAVLKRRFLASPKSCMFVYFIKYDGARGASDVHYPLIFEKNKSKAQDVFTVSDNGKTTYNFNVPHSGLTRYATYPSFPSEIEGGICRVVEGYPQTTMKSYSGFPNSRYSVGGVPIYVKTHYLYKCSNDYVK